MRHRGETVLAADSYQKHIHYHDNSGSGQGVWIRLGMAASIVVPLTVAGVAAVF